MESALDVSNPVITKRSLLRTYTGPLVTIIFLGIALVWLNRLGVQLRNAPSIFSNLYIAVALQSSLLALALMMFQFSGFVGTRLLKLFRSPARMLILTVLSALFLVLYPLKIAIALAVCSLFILEIYEGDYPLKRLANLILPALYLPALIIAVFSFNAIAATIRFHPDFDWLLAKADYVFLLGHSVSQLSHAFAGVAPSWALTGLEIAYFSLFGQIGATLICCALLKSREYAMRFVTTLALSYAITLIIFFALPTHSPYYNCSQHTTAPAAPDVVQVQEKLLHYAVQRSEGARLPLNPEYYVAFPCMHLTQALVVIWFMWPWRRIRTVFIVVNVALAAAIVLLEWHYFTDLIGGTAVAFAAIYAVNSSGRPTATVASATSTDSGGIAVAERA